MLGDAVARRPFVDPFERLPRLDRLGRVLHAAFEPRHLVGDQHRLDILLGVEVLGLPDELPGGDVEALALLAVVHEEVHAVGRAGPRDVLADERRPDLHPRDPVLGRIALAAVLVLEAVGPVGVAVGRVVGRAQRHRDLLHHRLGVVALLRELRRVAPAADARAEDDSDRPHHHAEDRQGDEDLDHREAAARRGGVAGSAPQRAPSPPLPVPAPENQTSLS